MSEKWTKGDKIDNQYEIHDVKRGGMGVVFLCYDHKNKIPIALKTFQDEYLKSRSVIDRFAWEAETWARLEKHRNIVRAYSVVSISARPYIMLEFVPGTEIYGSDLAGWIWGRGLEMKGTLSFAIQFCNGMIHAGNKFREMGKPFVHRDIKPSNIMVTKDKVVKLTDFGLVKAFAQSIEDIHIEISRNPSGVPKDGFTKVGSICGTPPYISPEQFRGEKGIDLRSDVYSFGCVLFEMVCGVKPFVISDAVDPAAMMYFYKEKHLKELPPKPHTMNTACPVSLNNLILKCLEKDPLKRYQNFVTLRDDLSGIYQQAFEEEFRTDETPAELDAEEWSNKGVAFSTLGRLSEALACYERALEIHPKCEIALNNKGMALGKLGKHLKALSVFEKILGAKPDSVEALYGKATALMELEKYEEALFFSYKGLETNPEDADIWDTIGEIYRRINRYDDAISAYHKVLQIQPKRIKVWNNMGAILKEIGNYEKAVSCFKMVLDINPSDVNALYNLGNTFGKIGKYEESIDCFERILDMFPHDKEAWCGKGFSLENVGRYEEALVCYEQSLTIDPKYAKAWNAKGFVLKEMGRLSEAVESFRKFIDHAPVEYRENVRQIETLIRELTS